MLEAKDKMLPVEQRELSGCRLKPCVTLISRISSNQMKSFWSQAGKQAKLQI